MIRGSAATLAVSDGGCRAKGNRGSQEHGVPSRLEGGQGNRGDQNSRRSADRREAAQRDAFKISKRRIQLRSMRPAQNSVDQRFGRTLIWCSLRREDGPMYKDIRIVPENERGKGQAITFVLAIGAVRQVCRLQTTFRTQAQAFSYFHKHRNAFERVAH